MCARLLPIVILLAGLSGCPEKWTAEQHLWQGVTMQKEKELDKAVFHFTKAVELDANLEEAFRRRATINLGVALATNDKDRIAQVVSDFSRSIELRKYNPSAYYFRGEAYRMQGRMKLALADFQASCKMRNTMGCVVARRIRDGRPAHGR
ncbi:MAG: hypothetical protein V3S11_04125 [Elusimicrobiota bacterium]